MIGYEDAQKMHIFGFRSYKGNQHFFKRGEQFRAGSQSALNIMSGEGIGCAGDANR